jgi:3',5'-nucleoside bisphosphate phosphatase
MGMKEQHLTSSTTPIALTLDAAIDLHMHTTYSDGKWPAEQLIDYLAAEKFELVAVTDHDRVDTVASIQALGAERHLPVLSGVEMTTEWRGHLTHLLCYGFDAQNNYLQKVADDVTKKQLENTYAVHDELVRRGYSFPRQEELLAATGGKLFRPIDNAYLIREHEYASNGHAALALMRDAGFYTVQANIEETADAAHRSQALCILAHPGRHDSGITHYTTALLDSLREEVPIDGIEVYHPYHSPEAVEMYREYVLRHHLLLSVGSDSHSIAGRMPTKHRAEVSKELLERLGVQFA